MFRADVYPYIKYELPNGVTFLLTPRPDRYTPLAVKQFKEQWNPKVRFQFTDDITEYEDDTPFHWYSWIPGKKLPTELVWTAVSLISKYAKQHGVIWMHCDSSSMRAPTFFGHWLRATQSPETAEDLVAKGEWTDGRQQSSPIYYSETSLKMDPGMKELIEVWQTAGEQAAWQHINKVKNPWDTDDDTSKE